MQKMINFDDVTKEKTKEHNCPQIPNHPYRILLIGDSGSGKINSLFNLISEQPDSGKIFLWVKDSHEAKYQFLINKRERAGLKYLSDSKYWKNNDDTYKKFKNYIKKSEKNEFCLMT